MRSSLNAAIAALGLVGVAIASPSQVDRPSPVVAETSILVSGSVRLADGTPVPGALVSVRGLPIAAVTDANGEYTVSVPAVPFVLVDAIAAVGGTAMHEGTTAVLLLFGGSATATRITIFPSSSAPPIL
ncbi:MAG: hypothetical protein AAF628_14055 [Planctomycetota bacterium]